MKWDGPAIVRQIQADEEIGWLELRSIVVFFRPKLLALRIVGPDVDDCLSEALLQLVRQIQAGDLKNPLALSKYVESVVRFSGIEFIKQRIRRNRREIPDELPPVETMTHQPDRPRYWSELVPARVDNERHYIARERATLRAKALRHGLKCLSLRHREVLGQALQGKSNTEVRTDLGLTDIQHRIAKNRGKTQIIPIARRRIAELERRGAT